MINYDTIKSVYDDKLTLMQWLNKVQEALKDATAVSFDVNKRGDATLTFSIVFDDGTELETDPIILEQGESVQSATLRNGHLILTLTNGDELDAGDMGAVSSFSIDANQHLIVTYQDGTTNDLGAIFSGNVTISGNLTAGIITAGGGLRTNYIDPAGGSVVNVGDISISSISSPNSADIVVYPKVKIFDKIADSQGKTRFFSNDITMEAIPGVTQTFGKMSMSGTHLLIVLCGQIAEGTTISHNDLLARVPLQQWIADEITPTISSVVAWLTAKSYYNTMGAADDLLIRVEKGNSELTFSKLNTDTFQHDGQFRIELNLLIP